MLGMIFVAGLVWGLLNPRAMLAAWRRERARERASREYRPTPPAPRPVVRVVGAVMSAHGRCFIARRAPHKSSAGKWEFPGGKVEVGERPEDALVRELREEFGFEVEVGEHLTRSSGEAGGVWVELDLYRVRWIGGPIKATDHDLYGWFKIPTLENFDWLEADCEALPSVLEALASWPAAPAWIIMSDPPQEPKP